MLAIKAIIMIFFNFDLLVHLCPTHSSEILPTSIILPYHWHSMLRIFSAPLMNSCHSVFYSYRYSLTTCTFVSHFRRKQKKEMTRSKGFKSLFSQTEEKRLFLRTLSLSLYRTNFLQHWPCRAVFHKNIVANMHVAVILRYEFSSMYIAITVETLDFLPAPDWDP